MKIKSFADIRVFAALALAALLAGTTIAPGFASAAERIDTSGNPGWNLQSFHYNSKVPLVGRVPLRAGFFREANGTPFRGNVLYLQGLGDSLRNHEPLFSRLSRAGYRTVAFDYMGQGGSDGSMNATRVADVLFPKLEIASIADEVWDGFRRRGPVGERKVVLGWSTGGLAAYRMAHRGQADAVVLIAPGIHPKVFMGDRMRITVPTLTSADYSHEADPHVDPVRPKSPLDAPLFALDLLGASFLSRSWRIPSRVAGLALLSGPRDSYVYSDRNRNTLRANAPHFKIVEYERALHEIDNEVREIREAAAAAILAFLGHVSSKANDQSVPLTEVKIDDGQIFEAGLAEAKRAVIGGNGVPSPPKPAATNTAIRLGQHPGVSARLPAPVVKETVEALAAAVDQIYFDPKVADAVAASLKKSLAADAYANAATPQELARLLTRDMYALTHDKHLALLVINKPAETPSRGSPSGGDREKAGQRSNWGIQKAEILPGNIGYLNITHFFHVDEAGGALSAAMQFLQNAEALILDLRANLGGSPDMAALTASYLLGKPGLPLFEIVARSGQAQRYATAAGSLLGRDGKRPLYALTSSETFSAGEGLAFILKEQKRATVIGETTAGAANPGQTYRLNDLFEAFVPNGQVRGAVSGGNWEGVGVAPDIRVPAADALRVAQERILRGLLAGKSPASGAWRELIERRIKELKTQKNRP